MKNENKNAARSVGIFLGILSIVKKIQLFLSRKITAKNKNILYI